MRKRLQVLSALFRFFGFSLFDFFFLVTIHWLWQSRIFVNYRQTGVASWYGRQFQGRKTASGDTFDSNSLTAAHRSLPMNCYIKVTNKSNGKSVVVKVNDRGPFSSHRVLDLSYAAAKQIGLASTGTGNVVIERVGGPN